MNKTRTIPPDIRYARRQQRTYQRLPKGWRSLRYGDTIKDGDQFWNGNKWERAFLTGRTVRCAHFIRRKTARASTPHQPK